MDLAQAKSEQEADEIRKLYMYMAVDPGLW